MLLCFVHLLLTEKVLWLSVNTVVSKSHAVALLDTEGGGAVVDKGAVAVVADSAEELKLSAGSLLRSRSRKVSFAQ